MLESVGLHMRSQLHKQRKLVMQLRLVNYLIFPSNSSWIVTNKVRDALVDTKLQQVSFYQLMVHLFSLIILTLQKHKIVTKICFLNQLCKVSIQVFKG